MHAPFAAPADASPARPGIEDRLAAMIRVPTVSAGADASGEPFEEFVALLADLYPLVHAHLACERIGGLGLVFSWSPRTAATPIRSC